MHSCIPSRVLGADFFLAVVIGLVLADTNYSSKGNVPKRSVVQVDHPALPLQFDKDSSKGQKACTSSNHAVKVHRKHCLLLFFFLAGDLLFIKKNHALDY